MPSCRLPLLRRPVAVLCALLLGWLLVCWGLVSGPADAWAAPVTDAARLTLTLPSDVEFVVGRTGDAYVIEAEGDPVPAIGVDRLPAGLRLVVHGDGTATISGTPTGPAGTATVEVLAQNGSGETRASLAVTIQQAPAFVAQPPLHFTVGELGSVLVRTAGFPAPSIGLDGDLPAGLSFVDNGDGTATIVGTPVDEAGSVPVTLTAVNVVADAAQTMTVRVLAETEVARSPAAGSPRTEPRWEI